MGNPIDDCMRDFAVDQLNKEAKGEKTYLDDIPNFQFMTEQALFHIKMADKGLNYKENMRIARDELKTAIKIIEDRLK